MAIGQAKGHLGMRRIGPCDGPRPGRPQKARVETWGAPRRRSSTVTRVSP